MIFNRSRKHRAEINETSITVEPRETLLQAALREGIDFPHSCRVGGCGACKCKLSEGKVKELTETGYLLSAEELDQGYILACQSVPRSDLRVEVDLEPEARGIPGKVIAQDKVTHDITKLTIQLDSAIDYKAGQFANVSIEGLDGVVRSYSFATPRRSDGNVSFFIRRVPGGAFSTHVNDNDVLGHQVRVEPPTGDFWMRPSEAPIMLVAGGSGLAPILAILQDTVAEGIERPATLLFGAREQRDLYALEEIKAIAKQWKGEFTFLPVLSEVGNGKSWDGACGLVTQHIAEHLQESSHAYLCGPPGMVDAAMDELVAKGVHRDTIHFDRFTTQADAVAAEATQEGEAKVSPLVQFAHYMKYFSFHFVGLYALFTLFAGGYYVSYGLLGILALYMLGDALLGDDTTTPEFKSPQILTVQLWMALPLLTAIVFAAVWSVSSYDLFGIGAFLSNLTGFDLLAAREATTFGQHACALITTGLMIGMVGTIPAHELTHRTWDPVSMTVGRWLLAFSFDTIFSIEHVYGHHRYVSTTHDPATAPRGRNVYAHIAISTVTGNVSAWEIEAERLQKKRLGVFSLHNAVIRGHLMSVGLVAAAFLVGGWVGAGFFILCALWGKSLLEIVNYMEHYGMVRNPDTPVQPRHSWNTNRRVSSWSMFNLTRHSHHHAEGEVPYQDLKPYPDAPMMLSGYLTTIAIALIPPLWNYLMVPKVLHWDRHFASDEERELAAIANAKSGIPALMNHTPSPVPGSQVSNPA